MGSVLLKRARRRFQQWPGSELVLRAELFNLEQIKRLGEERAREHGIGLRSGPDRLLPRLAENEHLLRKAYDLVLEAVNEGRRIAPAAEWLIDNFYLIEQHIQIARQHLPRGFSRELPHLRNGPLAGFPRVYDLALELISHVDGRVDAENAAQYLTAYQTVSPLKLGELWAFPIMLRLALIENLRRVACRIAARRTDRNLGRKWAERVLHVAEERPRDLIQVLAELARSEPPLESSTFVEEFLTKLQGRGPSIAFVLSWIEHQLVERGLSFDQLVRADSQTQAADQVSISNSIGSLHFLGAMDWKEFVETLSLTERALRCDPAGVYPEQNFATRDCYRHVIESLARKTGMAEEAVAQRVVELARQGHGDGATRERQSHVGFYLIDRGRKVLERELRPRSIPFAVARVGRRGRLAAYLASIIALTAIGTVAMMTAMPPDGWWFWLLLGCAALGASAVAVTIVNRLVPLIVPPWRLPRLDFSEGIPAHHRTIAVIPTLLRHATEISELLENLEVHFLGNRDPHLFFGLLTDFVDAPNETMPDDLALLDQARDGIAALNEKYHAPGRRDIFYLFHRPRVWNPHERLWMGYERKRGKLLEFNALLRGGPESAFSVILGDRAVLPTIKYVITLDSDTQMPRETGRKLVGAIAHPLNTPIYDARRGRVVEGYTILQPRSTASLPSASRSRFARMFAGEAGLDPYTRQVSDVYQDSFGEGTYVGKGIYHVDAFQQSLTGRFPDNLILSHDLLESGYARSALVSDIELLEDHPPSYLAEASRRHRWIRGDWQIAFWLGPRTPALQGRQANPLSLLTRWKILDNLRRSLVPPALVLWLVGGCLVFPAISGWWLGWLAVVIFAPALVSTLIEIVRKPAQRDWRLHVEIAIETTRRQLSQALVTLTMLPYDAVICLDAIAGSAGRLLVTRRGLLLWHTPAYARRNARRSLANFVAEMWVVPVIAALLASGLVAQNATADMWLISPVLILWVLSPLISWWISCPIEARRDGLAAKELEFVREVGRRTWRFFEEFVTEQENWLPPDNFQEYPAPTIATRTSPTNLAMGLLSNLAAWDFGYSTTGEFLTRTQATLAAMEKLERFRGHFYNWYDTRTIKALHPLYVSSVDSGNLAGGLVTLRAGLTELASQPIFSPRAFSGLEDTLLVVLREAPDMKQSVAALRAHLSAQPTSVPAAIALLHHLTRESQHMVADCSAELRGDAQWWARAFEHQCRALVADLEWLTAAERNPHPDPLERESASPAQCAGEAGRKSDERPGEGVSQAEPSISPLSVAGEAGPAQRGRVRGNGFTAAIPNGAEDTAPAPAPAPAVAPPDAAAPPVVIPTLEQLAQSHSPVVRQRAVARLHQIEDLMTRCGELVADMDFDFLHDADRRLLAIGYNVANRRRDPSCYDLLASEARLTSFLLIAHGQLLQEHWFALNRLLTRQHGQTALLSWSGSMFEYLMPMLVMPSYENTLLHQTCKAVVERQIQYGQQRGVPWGISESCYNAVDLNRIYQYRAFGVPGLGLKRGLGDDLVIAPYATVMSLMIDPAASVANMQRLTAEGYLGRYGFLEAIDYTPSRVPRGKECVPIRTFMAHHLGMSLLAINHLLLKQAMPRRFVSDPVVKATTLLLQERVPRLGATLFPHAAEARQTAATTAAEPAATMRVLATPDTPLPEVHLLSNGKYHVMATHAGGGYSRWGDLALTRWREDVTCDDWGTFVYIRDLEHQLSWSAAHQPTRRKADMYEAIFLHARVEYRRRDDELDCHTEICVSSEDDVEIRRLTLRNLSRHARTIEITSYAEVVLAPLRADIAHRAFSNLFVQTEIVPDRQAILCTRRPRSPEETPPFLVHLVSVNGTEAAEPSYETDRARFIGRTRTPERPVALDHDPARRPDVQPLSNTAGAVLDPIVAMRRVIRLQPEEAATVYVVTGVSQTRDAALTIADKYRDPRFVDRAFEISWSHSQMLLRHLNVTEADAQIYGRLAGSVLFANPLHRAHSNVIARNRLGQPALWRYGVSGDLPIVLVRIADLQRIDLVKHALQAHAFWRERGLAVDLVILNEDFSGYRQALNDKIMELVAAGTEAQLVDKSGGLFLRRSEQMPEEDRLLFQAVARVILTDSAETLAEQVERRRRVERLPAPFTPTVTAVPEKPAPRPERNLAFYNGLGGFTADGREYVMVLGSDQTTPTPWCNVIANPVIGTVISESGGAYTWVENAHEFRLSKWNNDPVTDATGEAFYIRDDETGRFWSPTPLPARGTGHYVVRHGFGYSVFEHVSDGVMSELSIYVAIDAPVKLAVLRLRNQSARARRLSITSYCELVLGEIPDTQIVTEVDPHTGALFARNAYHREFSDRVVFTSTSESRRTWTCSRTEFLGRNGSFRNPAALGRVALSGRVGAGLDPCAALQATIELAPGGERDVVFVLGAARNTDEAQHFIRRFGGVGGARQALEAVWHQWNRLLGTTHLETPDPALDILVNGWLEYQALACRVWGRSGYYQSGGAFGFRDQLQDTMALMHGAPWIAREQLLRCAERQFREGDVQHWWHPPAGRGVRTRISDDYLWLPYAAARYVACTGDTGVLDQRTAFLEGRPVNPDEESYYDLPIRSTETATLYEHCVRAIERGLRFGEHGLPLMGAGDWNDGMNLVGIHGTGESVWLAWFFCDVLKNFGALAKRKGDEVFATRCATEAGQLRENIEKHAWDGAWYRRAYFDDGRPLGSAGNDECQIDSISQSWAIVSGAGDPKRARQAMAAVNQRLVKRSAKLIQLLDPPFDKSAMNPGYIKGYVPGVRENGGQYTHGAIWTVMAFAQMGDWEKAWELFNLLNPIRHGTKPDETSVYKVEPYVVAADVYAVSPHTGRGGWTWYTGSAGWMYRLITETLLGIHLEVDKLRFAPRLPASWPGYKLHYRFRDTFYHLSISKRTAAASKVVRVVIDGKDLPGEVVPLIDDRVEHRVEIELG